MSWWRRRTGRNHGWAASDSGFGCTVDESERCVGDVLPPRRWAVERNFAWTTRFRRLASDYERLPTTVAGLDFVAVAFLMLHRLLILAAQSPKQVLAANCLINATSGVLSPGVRGLHGCPNCQRYALPATIANEAPRATLGVPRSHEGGRLIMVLWQCRILIVAFVASLAVFSHSIPARAVCPDGIVMPPQTYFPDLSNGFTITSDDVREADQLAATFPDPADARSRLAAWCWVRQAERIYTRGWISIDISVHVFGSAAGASLALPWFIEQRAEWLGLERDTKMTPLQAAETPRGSLPFAWFNANEYTIYYLRDNVVVRVTVSGEQSAVEADHDVIAYQVLALMFPDM